MNFTSILFLFIFLPVFILIQLISHPKFRLPILLTASVIFLAAGQIQAIWWLGGLLSLGYMLGLVIARQKKDGINGKKWLWAGIGLNLALLVFFKITIPFWERSMHFLQLPEAWVSPVNSIAAPIGLSYVTFQMISYLIDVWRGTTPAETNFFKLASYLFYFPKLVSGPLTRYKAFKDQVDQINPSMENIAGGLRRFMLGFVKRALISNQLSLFTNAAFNQPTPNLEPRFAWLALAAYSLQIFFDFAGYSDMAIGLAQMMGMRLPENFNYPYIAQSISDFWRRWHIKLTTWFREYVFYPLERRRFKWAGQQINILIVFTLTGIWHGFKPSFIVWGLLHGVFLALESLGLGRKLNQLWRPLRHLYTLVIVVTGWVFFRSNNLAFAFGFFQRLAGNTSGLTALPFSQTTPLPFVEPTFIIALAAGVVFCLPLSARWNQFRADIEKQKSILFFAFQPVEDVLLIALSILSLAALLSSTYAPSIYAKF
jgi:alginate O-acetyltransferase complex protein AlgI